MIAGIFLFVLITIIIAINNSSVKNKYKKSVLADPIGFKSKWMREYEQALAEQKSELPENEKFTLDDFEKIVDSYVNYLRNGIGKKTFDMYMVTYMEQIREAQRDTPRNNSPKAHSVFSNTLQKSSNVGSQKKTVYGILMDIPEVKEQKELHNLLGNMCENGTEQDMIPEGYGEFGLDITNPIPVHTIYGSISYLGRLRTLDGTKVNYDRIGSMHAPNISSIIDGYTISINGQKIATLYISPYHKKNSDKAPRGFRLRTFSDSKK